MMSKTAEIYHSFIATEDSDSKAYPIRDIFQSFWGDYTDSHSVSKEQQKAALCISECKTGSLGYNLSYCESCGHTSIHACSCNNRNCPSCQAPQEQKWIMARNSELIEGCAYYHCIFTLPFELNDLIYENQKLLYNLMFSCVSDTLLTFAVIKIIWAQHPESSWYCIHGGKSLTSILTFTAPYRWWTYRIRSVYRGPATKDFSFRWKQWERCSVVKFWPL